MAGEKAKRSPFFQSMQAVSQQQARKKTPSTSTCKSKFHSKSGKWVNGGSALSATAEYSRGFAQALIEAWRCAPHQSESAHTGISYIDALEAVGFCNRDKMLWVERLCSSLFAVKEQYMPLLMNK